MIREAINHYKYGISHDIFKEPVTSYAKLSIDALEKQLPTKPIVKHFTFDKTDWYHCPSCETSICYVGHLINRYKYCKMCGQALDWSE